MTSSTSRLLEFRLSIVPASAETELSGALARLGLGALGPGDATTAEEEGREPPEAVQRFATTR